MPAKIEVKHVGGPFFEVAGKRIHGKEKAEQYAAELENIERRVDEPDLSDKLPEGFAARTHILKWRDSVMELPMNEIRLPDDSNFNKYYDREWMYVWGSTVNRNDIPNKMAEGFQPVSYGLLEELVKDDKCPEHYLSLLREEGRFAVYGDAALLRIPRVWQRQRQAERERAAIERIRVEDRKVRDDMDNANMRPAPVKAPNEVRISIE